MKFYALYFYYHIQAAFALRQFSDVFLYSFTVWCFVFIHFKYIFAHRWPTVSDLVPCMWVIFPVPLLRRLSFPLLNCFDAFANNQLTQLLPWGCISELLSCYAVSVCALHWLCSLAPVLLDLLTILLPDQALILSSWEKGNDRVWGFTITIFLFKTETFSKYTRR